MAKRTCGATDRLDQTRVRRSCDRLRRATSASSAALVPAVLPTAPEHICHWPKTHRCRDASMPPGAFFRCRSSADCITIMSGSDLRHGQESQTLTFSNYGNRPVSIQRISYIIQPTKKPFEQLGRFNCEIEFLTANSAKRAVPDEFTPIVIKPNDIETRTYRFRGNIEKADAGPFDDPENHLMSCIYV